MLRDYFRFAFGTLRHRKTRSYLTMIGIFIGIAAVVSLISIGQGLEGAITEEFEQLGINKIIVMPGGGFFAGPPGSSKAFLTNDDVDTVEKVKGIRIAGALVYKVTPIELGNERKYTWVTGFPIDERWKIIEEMQSFKVAKGREYKRGDKFKVGIGYLIAEGKFFEKPVKVGQKIKINGHDFDVIAIMEPIGNPQDDSSVYMPIDSYREIFNEKEKVDTIMAEVMEGEEPSVVAERVKKALRKSHGVEKGNEDFTVQTTEQLMETFGTILSVMQAVLIGIAGISLLVGGIGIMNTMYTAVLERTKEIGIMKAVGAQNSDILMIFLIESGLMGLIGGVIGVIIGIGLSKGVEMIALAALSTDLLRAHISLPLIAGALLFSFVVGAISGIVPAKQAARMHPVDALKFKM